MRDFGRYTSRFLSLPDLLKLEANRRLSAAHELVDEMKAFELDEARLQARQNVMAMRAERSSSALLLVGGVVLIFGILFSAVATWNGTEGSSSTWQIGAVIMLVGAGLVLWSSRLKYGRRVHRETQRARFATRWGAIGLGNKVPAIRLHMSEVRLLLGWVPANDPNFNEAELREEVNEAVVESVEKLLPNG